MSDKDNNANLVDFTIVKSGKVARSALGVETFGLADACGAAIIIRHHLKMILNRTLNVILLTDSETLFNFIISNGQTT